MQQWLVFVEQRLANDSWRRSWIVECKSYFIYILRNAKLVLQRSISCILLLLLLLSRTDTRVYYVYNMSGSGHIIIEIYIYELDIDIVCVCVWVRRVACTIMQAILWIQERSICHLLRQLVSIHDWFNYHNLLILNFRFFFSVPLCLFSFLESIVVGKAGGCSPKCTNKIEKEREKEQNGEGKKKQIKNRQFIGVLMSVSFDQCKTIHNIHTFLPLCRSQMNLNYYFVHRESRLYWFYSQWSLDL